MNLYILSLCLVLNFGISLCDNRPEINTPLGTIRGTYQTSIQGRVYSAFEGIPYAKPPVKKYRFREPRPIGKWNGVLDARFLYSCMQYNHYGFTVTGEEDCLYVNVYTPSYNSSNLLDVIVFIHGGAFMFGAGHIYRQDIIMDRDVVYINLNYRVGPFGFLSTEDSTVPGNNGMKDQALALKWIKNNIIYFGGNPESITITGMSAGGASVHLHYMSPLSQGLFTRGFSLSGTALNPWVLQENALDKAKQLASYVNCETENVKQMINCLTYMPAKNIVQALPKFFKILYNPFSPFGVVVEPKGTPNAFLTMHPYVALKKNRIQDLPWLVSHVKSEGLYPGAEYYSDEKYFKELESKWTELAPFVLDFNYTKTTPDHTALAANIKEYYLKGKPISKETFMNLIEMIGDRLFVTDSQIAAKLQAHVTKSPVHYYYFTYRGAHSKSEAFSKVNVDFGTAHGDDTAYVLKSNVDVFTTESDKQMITVLLDFWTGLAADGTPRLLGKTWKTVSKNLKDPLNYIEIKSPTEVVEHSKDFDNVEFWANLPLKENSKLFSHLKDEL